MTWKLHTVNLRLCGERAYTKSDSFLSLSLLFAFSLPFPSFSSFLFSPLYTIHICQHIHKLFFGHSFDASLPGARWVAIPLFSFFFYYTGQKRAVLRLLLAGILDFLVTSLPLLCLSLLRNYAMCCISWQSSSSMGHSFYNTSSSSALCVDRFWILILDRY